MKNLKKGYLPLRFRPRRAPLRVLFGRRGRPPHLLGPGERQEALRRVDGEGVGPRGQEREGASAGCGERRRNNLGRQRWRAPGSRNLGFNNNNSDPDQDGGRHRGLPPHRVRVRQGLLPPLRRRPRPHFVPAGPHPPQAHGARGPAARDVGVRVECAVRGDDAVQI